MSLRARDERGNLFVDTYTIYEIPSSCFFGMTMILSLRARDERGNLFVDTYILQEIPLSCFFGMTMVMSLRARDERGNLFVDTYTLLEIPSSCFFGMTMVMSLRARDERGNLFVATYTLHEIPSLRLRQAQPDIWNDNRYCRKFTRSDERSLMSISLIMWYLTLLFCTNYHFYDIISWYSGVVANLLKCLFVFGVLLQNHR